MATKIIAHRGDSENHPENTLSAFQAALEKGVDAIELDVHFTKDGQLVVHHDYYLGNPDDGEGLIYEKDLAYIQSLRIGSEKIPTLEEVFKQIGDKLHYEIELKGFAAAFLEKVLSAAKTYNLLDKIEFTSPVSYNLTRLKTMEPRANIGMFVAPLPGWMSKNLGQTLAIQNALLGGIDVLHCPLEIIDKNFIERAHQKDIVVHAADCDTEDELRQAISLGVDQLSTAKLSEALQIRGEPMQDIM